MKSPSLACAAAIAALSAVLAACTPADAPSSGETAAPAAAAPAATSPDVHPFMIGALQAWALKDGSMAPPVGGADTPWKDNAAVTAALTAAGLPGDKIPLSIQPLLVRDGDRLVLIDTGANGEMGTEGKLQASLKAAGIDPATVTDVLISHAHGDHVGGLANAQGRLAFPNATIHMSAPEWAYAQVEGPKQGAGPLIAAITPKVQTFQPGAQVTPSIKAVPLAGHTPGHTGYQIGTGETAVLYFGDAMHSHVVSVARPDLTNAWDSDAAAGAATRRDLLARAADGHMRLYGNHFPYPGLGRVERAGDGYRWVPEN